MDSFFDKYSATLKGSSDINSKKTYFREWKPALIQDGFYDFLLGNSSYSEFQNQLFALAKEPKGFDLAFSCMVEVNVAGSILLECSETSFGSSLKKNISSLPLYIVAAGVSEKNWEGKLKNLSSTIEENKLYGEKSFITNGESADGIFWIVPESGVYPVYYIDLHKYIDLQKREAIFTEFTPHVGHLKIELLGYPISTDLKILEDYGNLGLVIRLKELFSLVSLLLGFTSSLCVLDKTIQKEWESLFQFWFEYKSKWDQKITLEDLKKGFPYPTTSLLESISNYYQLTSPAQLNTIDPNYQLFFWKDTFTKFLKRKTK